MWTIKSEDLWQKLTDKAHLDNEIVSMKTKRHFTAADMDLYETSQEVSVNSISHSRGWAKDAIYCLQRHSYLQANQKQEMRYISSHSNKHFSRKSSITFDAGGHIMFGVVGGTGGIWEAGMLPILQQRTASLSRWWIPRLLLKSKLPTPMPFTHTSNHFICFFSSYCHFVFHTAFLMGRTSSWTFGYPNQNWEYSMPETYDVKRIKQYHKQLAVMAGTYSIASELR